MEPDTRAQDMRKLEESLESASREQAQKCEQMLTMMEANKTEQEKKFTELTNLISRISFQKNSFL
jgi:hypothetical protein